MAILEAKTVSVQLEQKMVLNHIDLAIPCGKITAIIGPNGSGKSTLLKTLSKNLLPSRGKVYFNGRNMAAISNRELARRLAVLSQSPQSPPDLTVRDLVEYGRFPHRNWWQGSLSEDETVVEDALTATGMTVFQERLLSSLSGGERQRAWIAMALAQRPEVLLLDEPTTYLDISHQLEVLELVADLNRKNGITVVMVVHDINQAAQYSDFIVVLKEGTVFASGTPADLITSAMLRDVFGVESAILQMDNHRPLFFVRGLSGKRERESKVDMDS
ncbi:Fe(3+)-citrate import ATP-binding protein YfmF [Propionispora sp. 2/2-37]|uniref:ABC transporter ATP-binding protein n=1 Tax=Propionispora sp. 2/2-37 TaxID=1677858 RepID=UPI0006BB88D1|nr:ABC transporter ATP-binding protein [Propionispora sp. 2/2-37]CUH94646.1 Fe(3+)-citrate import ATP-binding protein YfmF [Propionispora sp. 2/2-37]